MNFSLFLSVSFLFVFIPSLFLSAPLSVSFSLSLSPSLPPLVSLFAPLCPSLSLSPVLSRSCPCSLVRARALSLCSNDELCRVDARARLQNQAGDREKPASSQPAGACLSLHGTHTRTHTHTHTRTQWNVFCCTFSATGAGTNCVCLCVCVCVRVCVCVCVCSRFRRPGLRTESSQRCEAHD